MRKLGFLMIAGMLCCSSMYAQSGNGDGNNKSSKVVGKDSKNKNSKYTSKEKKEELKKSKEIAEVTSTESSEKAETLSAVDKFILSKYMDLDEMDFNKPVSVSYKLPFIGYYQLKKECKIQKEILTIIDFTLPSSQKRMWVIDMKENKVLYNTVVSHGKNSGKEYATRFSNRPESHQSSLGFYATAETYIGKHGLSLRLDGLEKGINDNARMRDIVIHGASYANESWVDAQGWLGRSYGCPALPMNNY